MIISKPSQKANFGGDTKRQMETNGNKWQQMAINGDCVEGPIGMIMVV